MTIPHLDTEALSAALDGESTVDQDAHLSTCRHCRKELQSLGAVVRAVATPVPPRPAAAVDAAIANALGRRRPGAVPGSVGVGSGVEPAGSVGAGLGVEPAGSVGVGLGVEPAGSVGAGSGVEPAGDPVAMPARRRSARWVLAAVGAAAAVVLFGGLVAVVGRSGSRSSSSGPSIAAPAQREASSSTSVPETEFAGDAATPGDLGAQSDAAVVARLVTEAIGASSGELASGATPAAAATSNTTTSKKTTSNETTPNTAALALPKAPCVAEAGAALGIVGGDVPAGSEAAVRYVATLRWRGQVAIVVVFSATDRLSGAIMKTVDCSLLAVLPL